MNTKCSIKCVKENTKKKSKCFLPKVELLKNPSRHLFIALGEFRVGSGSGRDQSTVAPRGRSTVCLGGAGQLGNRGSTGQPVDRGFS